MVHPALGAAGSAEAPAPMSGTSPTIHRNTWRRIAPAVAALAWGGNHFTPLLLMYRRIEGYTFVEVDLFFAAYVVGIVPGFLLAGPLSDRHGRRALVAVGLALAVVASMVLAFGSTNVNAMCLGRLVSGVSVAIAMVVGTTWLKELSAGATGPTTGARRASMILTSGFGLGAATSGALAQWGPAPTLLPYGVHITLCLAAAPMLHRLGDARSSPGPRRFVGMPRIPQEARARFNGVVLPMAPWVFGALALAFVAAPAIVASQVSANAVAFATLLCIVALGSGAAVQPFFPHIVRLVRGRQLVLGLGLIAAGTGTLAVAAQILLPMVVVFAAILLGSGYGVCILSGLIEVQAMVGPQHLAGATAIYYSLTYVGFAFPAILAGLTLAAPYPVLLLATAAACLACARMVRRRLGAMAPRQEPMGGHDR